MDIFQLTSSQGGWLRVPYRLLLCSFFNSHPHKEDDRKCCFSCAFCTFSTHILTRRMTLHHSRKSLDIELFNSHPHKEDDFGSPVPLLIVGFSTHILTRRMTFVHPQIYRVFIFQLTSSQGGWRYIFFAFQNYYNFSTHILTRRMTQYHIFFLLAHLFQLTSSQGGWHPSVLCL